MSIYETLADNSDYFLLKTYKSSSIAPHFHRSIEFVYTLKGKTEFFINGDSYTLSENQIYFVPSFYVHSNKNVSENEILTLVFSHLFFKSFPDRHFNYVLDNEEENKKIYSYLKNFLNHYIEKKGNIPYLKKQAFINDFLYQLTNVYPLSPIKNTNVNHIIMEILNYINEHFAEDLSLDSLSKKFGYCKQHFSSLFNKYIGRGLNSYINNLRIENALKMMNDENNKKAVITIAFECGFKSLATFYRCLESYKKENNLVK